MPALYKLHRKDKLADLPIICVSRRNISTEEYIQLIELDKLDKDKERLALFTKKIIYFSLDVEQEKGEKLGSFIQSLEAYKQCKDILFYLSIAPSLALPTLKRIEESALVNKETKLVIEKPFGTSEKSAIELNNTITKLFDEKNIYRVDHYLGKALVTNLLALRFTNQLFETIWNNEYIDNVQITLAEEVGIEGRGEYYEQTGVIRDMVQNHILQMISLTAMERPPSLDAEDIRTAKVKIINALASIPAEDIVIGQYDSYLKEEFINPDSKNPTFIAAKFMIDTPRWKGVPFYIRTGKKLKEKYTEINIILKEKNQSLFTNTNQSNVISIRVEPQEGIAIQFRSLIPGSKELQPVSMEFCHNCEFGSATPEAYEAVIKNALEGDQTLFSRWDETQASWKFTDKLIETATTIHPLTYKPGSMGPQESADLLKKKYTDWISIERKLTL